MRLDAEIVPVTDVGHCRRDEMFALMDRYYVGVRRDVFEADLSEKHWVIQIVDAVNQTLRGFSTQMLLDVSVAGRPVRALFSGDTIVDHRFWTRNPLAPVWGRFALSLIDENPSAEMYWFLITKGYRTYRFLPLFFREFYPRYDAATPRWAADVIDALARFKYPNAYDSAAGIIRSSTLACRLRPGVADITTERLANPQIRFFHERTPGHVEGDELCCIAALTRENFTRTAYRVMQPPAVPLALES